MSVVGKDYILGFFVVDDVEYEFFSKFSKRLYEHLKEGKTPEIKDVRKITFSEGEQNE